MYHGIFTYLYHKGPSKCKHIYHIYAYYCTGQWTIHHFDGICSLGNGFKYRLYFRHYVKNLDLYFLVMFDPFCLSKITMKKRFGKNMAWYFRFDWIVFAFLCLHPGSLIVRPQKMVSWKSILTFGSRSFQRVELLKFSGVNVCLRKVICYFLPW